MRAFWILFYHIWWVTKNRPKRRAFTHRSLRKHRLLPQSMSKNLQVLEVGKCTVGSSYAIFKKNNMRFRLYGRT